MFDAGGGVQRDDSLRLKSPSDLTNLYKSADGILPLCTRNNRNTGRFGVQAIVAWYLADGARARAHAVFHPPGLYSLGRKEECKEGDGEEQRDPDRADGARARTDAIFLPPREARGAGCLQGGGSVHAFVPDVAKTAFRGVAAGGGGGLGRARELRACGLALRGWDFGVGVSGFGARCTVRALLLGVYLPSSDAELSGQGVQNIALSS
jgi:hypothetical protein